MKLRYHFLIAGLIVAFLPVMGWAYQGPGGLMQQNLYRCELTGDGWLTYPATGTVDMWNTRVKLQLRVAPEDLTCQDSVGDWKIKKLDVYIGNDPVPLKPNGTPDLDVFPYRVEYDEPAGQYALTLDLEEDLDFRWGRPYEELRQQNLCVHGVFVFVDRIKGKILYQRDVWTVDPDFEATGPESEAIVSGIGKVRQLVVKGNANRHRQNHANGFLKQKILGHWGYDTYEMAHPRRAHFIDSPVGGMTFQTPTHYGRTDESGAFDYFPGETVDLAIGGIYIGSTPVDHKISPLDLFQNSDIDDPRVINMARLLQSLDADADPKKGIQITDAVETAFAAAMAGKGLDSIDFSDGDLVEAIIQDTIVEAQAMGGPLLVMVSAEDAQAHLGQSTSTDMFRKKISRTPDLASAKAKLNIMGVWFPALKANGDPAQYTDDDNNLADGIPYYYYDEEAGTSELLRVATEAKPIIATFCDADPETGAHDVWAAVSRDDGNTWKRKNISRMAYRSSFQLANGQDYYGDCKKPVFQVKGNKILIAWTSKFAKGGKPRYAINLCDDPATEEVETLENGCAVYCNGKVEDGTYVCEEDDPNDDGYWEDDIWGVSGPQRSHNYTEDGYPEVGEVPYSAVWVARGIILTSSDLSKSPWNGVDSAGDPLYNEGDIVWFKPERLTSGRRDANQVFMGGADGAGFAIAWQEDPGGLRPGEAKGPGPGWGGATTNHKTDIWYSYLTWADFAKVDENFVSGGDPQHDFGDDHEGRPKALVPMSLPVRISDNDAVNTDNMLVELNAAGLPVLDDDGNFIPITNPDATSEDADGSHRYGYMLDGLWNWDGSSIYYEGEDNSAWQPGSGALYEFVNQQDETKRVVITADGRALDGNTGASRPNLFLQTYTKPDGSKSAWAIMAYEETKGMGSGPPEETGTGGQPQDGSGYDPYAMVPDEGKNAIYHSFDFQDPDLVSAGTILNLPETDDETGEPLYVVEPDYLGSTLNADGTYTPIANPLAGEEITDWKGDPQLAYENARRPRFILQGKAGAFGGTKPDGSFKEPDNSGTVLIVLYKEGEEGAGRPSDIMMRRCVVKDPNGVIRGGNPWDPKNFIPHNDSDTRMAVQNLSTVNPLETWVNPDRDENAKGDGTKVCSWDQPEECLTWKSGVNPYEDSRAHRGAIRGDFVIMGYSYCPNWAASRKAHDKYDFYIRRSFDGGENWTTDPAYAGDVTHIDYFFDPEGVSGAELDEEGNDASEPTKHYTVDTAYAGGGVYEPARNVSLLKNNKISVIEPRIVAVPGTIKVDGEWTGIAEDKQDPNVFYVAYGTSTNLPDVEKAPEDLFLSYSLDRGNTLAEDTWVVNPDSDGNHAGEEVSGWYRLAKGDQEQGEVQIRMTPNGERFYGVWLDEGEEGSDIMFRRMCPVEFLANVPE